MKMHTNRKDTRFGAQLSRDFVQRSTKRLAVSAGRLQDFHSKSSFLSQNIFCDYRGAPQMPMQGKHGIFIATRVKRALTPTLV